MRVGEVAAPPSYNQQFAAFLEQASSCQLLGPDYYLYPNRLFSDQTHVNDAGARTYTEALYRLLESRLSSEQRRALE
jgi:hypothetical protein